MLKDLERAHNLPLTRKQTLEQDAFGYESRKEILEPYDEKKEAEWRVQHRQKEKQYRQKLAELRNREKTKINDEERLWKVLDELEEELDRFDAECRDVDYDENSEVDAIENDIENLLL
jgi:NADH dehydrogenase/NADH:ubiquinone oxidoreductase subunit G